MGAERNGVVAAWIGKGHQDHQFVGLVNDTGDWKEVCDGDVEGTARVIILGEIDGGIVFKESFEMFSRAGSTVVDLDHLCERIGGCGARVGILCKVNFGGEDLC